MTEKVYRGQKIRILKDWGDAPHLYGEVFTVTDSDWDTGTVHAVNYDWSLFLNPGEFEVLW